MLSGIFMFVVAQHPMPAKGSSRLPAEETMRQVLSGSVSVNRTPANYYLFEGGDGPRALRRRAKTLGWAELSGVGGGFESPFGEVFFTGYGKGSEVLLVGSPKEGAPDGVWTVMVRFARLPAWIDARGEAPGDEPPGWPRLMSSRRILHLAAEDFEAACYTSPASAAMLIARAKERLAGAGWKVTQTSGMSISAERTGDDGLTLFARDEGRGCSFMLISGRVRR